MVEKPYGPLFTTTDNTQCLSRFSVLGIATLQALTPKERETSVGQRISVKPGNKRSVS